MVLNRAKELVVELSDADISQLKPRILPQYSKKLDKMNDKYRKVNDLEATADVSCLILLRMMI